MESSSLSNGNGNPKKQTTQNGIVFSAGISEKTINGMRYFVVDKNKMSSNYWVSLDWYLTLVYYYW